MNNNTLSEQISCIDEFMKQQEWETVIKECSVIRKVNSRIPFVFIRAAIALRHLKRYDEALELLDQSIGLHPDAVNNLVQKAIILSELEKYEEALQNWYIVLKKDKYISLAYIQIERICSQLEKQDGFVEIYENLVNELYENRTMRFEQLQDFHKYLVAEGKQLFIDLYASDEKPQSIFCESNKITNILKDYLRRKHLNIYERFHYKEIALSTKDIINYNVIDVQDKLIRDKTFEIVSPITNKMISATKSIVVNDFLFGYIFIEDDTPYFLFFSKHVPEPAMLFLPMQNTLFVFNNNEQYKNQFSQFVNHSIDFFSFIKEYLRKPNSQSVVAWVRNAHIGHHLWNDLTAINRIVQKDIVNQLHELIILNYKKTEIYDKIDDIFNNENLKTNRKMNTSEKLSKHIYENNFIGLLIGDRCIENSLIERIKSRFLLNDEFVQKYRDVIDNSLVFVVGLRYENRTWVNQKEGIVEVINYILENTENNLTIIIDGHNLSYENISIRSHKEANDNSVIELEKMAYNYIKQNTYNDRVNIVSAVGLPILENLYLIEKSNFFIAPWGAGLAKYKWISNKDGIIFTSSYNMDNKGDLNIYENNKIRENATKCLYVDKKYIDDINDSNNLITGTSADEYRANFYVDVKGIFEKIDLLLNQYTKGEI